MNYGVMNKSTILNRFVLHTLQRNITQSCAVVALYNSTLVARLCYYIETLKVLTTKQKASSFSCRNTAKTSVTETQFGICFVLETTDTGFISGYISDLPICLSLYP